MRTVIYARFSSDNQNPRSIADQIALCRDRADREGWSVVATFEDAATSGAAGISELQRPGLSALLKLVEAGGIDQVLAESTDRIARHAGDMITIREVVEFAGARIFTLFDGTVTSMVGLIKGFTDSQFRTDLAARVKRGQRGGIKEGRSAGGVSYGYRRANTLVDGELVRGLREIDTDRAEIIRRIYNEFAAGLSARAIAGRLNADGVPPPRAGYWHTSTILGEASKGMGILRNRLYVGELVYGRTKGVTNPRTRKMVYRVNDGEALTVQPVPELRIIDQALWESVQARLSENTGKRPERARRPKYMLSGLVQCAACGSNYVVRGAQNWECGRHLNGNDCTNNRLISNRKLERIVLDDLKREMLAPDLVAEYVREYHRDYARKSANLGRDRARLQRQLAEATRKMERIVEAFAGGGSEFAEIRTMLTTARDDKERLASELANLEALPVLALHPGLAEDYRREVMELEAALANDEQKLETIPKIRAMIARVVLRPSEGKRGVSVEVVRHLEEILLVACGGKRIAKQA